MTKLEKITYLGCPWFFAMVLIINGIYMGFALPEKLIGVLSTGLGLICMSLYCICSLLVKLIEAR